MISHPAHNSAILFAQRQAFSARSPLIRASISETEDKTVTLQGFNLGFLANLNFKTRDDSLAVFRTWMPSHEPASSSIFLTGESAFQACCRTLMLDCTGSPRKRPSVADIDGRMAAFEEWRSRGFDDQDYDTLWTILADALSWRFVITDEGFYCMVPLEQDRIVVLHRTKVPVVVRSARVFRHDKPASEKGIGGMEKHRCVRLAYMHEFVDGRAGEWAEAGKVDKRSFALV